MEIKTKINKWDLIKLKTCTTKETISKVERQPSEWEKITASEATNKELISKIYKQLTQLNTRKIKRPNQKMGQRATLKVGHNGIRHLASGEPRGNFGPCTDP